MTLTREDPAALRRPVRQAAWRTAGYLALTGAVGWAVLTYGGMAVTFVRELGVRGRDVTFWRPWVTLVLVGWPGVFALAALVELVRLVGRYLTARRWERQLADPARAASVPPLEGHLIDRTRTGVGWAVLRLFGWLLACVVLGGLGYAFATGVVRLDDPGEAWFGLGGTLLALLGCLVGAWRDIRVARRAAVVENLSSSGPAESGVRVRGAVAAVVPTLEVRFAGGLRPGAVDLGVASGRVPHLLYLRLFDNLAGTDAFVKRWRRVGLVHFLRSADQVGADELATWSRQVGDLSVFIDNDAELDEVLHAPAPASGPDGYPAQGLLCHGSYWKRAVTRLLVECDAVFLDLTGYHAGHGGTAFEVQSAFDLIDVGKLRLVAAPGSDQQFLAAQLRYAWSQMVADSPNAGEGTRRVTVYVG